MLMAVEKYQDNIVKISFLRLKFNYQKLMDFLTILDRNHYFEVELLGHLFDLIFQHRFFQIISNKNCFNNSIHPKKSWK